VVRSSLLTQTKLTDRYRIHETEMNQIHRLLIVSSVTAIAIVATACSDQSKGIVPPTAEPTQIAPAPTNTPTVEPTAVPSTATPVPANTPTVTPAPATPTVIPPTSVPPTAIPPTATPVEITFPSEISHTDLFEVDNEGWTADSPICRPTGPTICMNLLQNSDNFLTDSMATESTFRVTTEAMICSCI